MDNWWLVMFSSLDLLSEASFGVQGSSVSSFQSTDYYFISWTQTLLICFMMTVPGGWHLDLFKLLHYHFLWCSFLLSAVNVICRQINNLLSFAGARNKRGGSQLNRQGCCGGRKQESSTLSLPSNVLAEWSKAEKTLQFSTFIMKRWTLRSYQGLSHHCSSVGYQASPCSRSSIISSWTSLCTHPGD